MTGEQLALLIIRLGPIALDLARKLVETWTRPMTPEELIAITESARKTYDDYIAEARRQGNQS